MTDDRAARKAKTLWLKAKTEFTGNWHIDLDDQAIIVNAFAAELSKAYAEDESMTDDRATKKAEELLPCFCGGVYEEGILNTGRHAGPSDDDPCPAYYRPAVAAELSKAYAKGDLLVTEQDRAAQKAAELLPEPACPECKTGVLRPHCFLDLSTTECPRHAIARNLRRKREAVAAELRTLYDKLNQKDDEYEQQCKHAQGEIDVLNKRIATEYVRGREHEQRARDTVHVPHIEQLKAEIAGLRAELQHWREAAASVGQPDGHGWAEETKSLRAELANMKKYGAQVREEAAKIAENLRCLEGNSCGCHTASAAAIRKIELP